jgi:hypothetical protein
MNKTTKKWLTIFAGLIFVWWLLFFDLRVYQLNNVLEKDPEINSYPYSFSVVSFDEGVATISSPRSGKVSAVTVLRALDPTLKNKRDDSPQLVAAQQKLAELQSRAAEIIMQEQDVKSISWELDEYWLRNHGIEVF